MIPPLPARAARASALPREGGGEGWAAPAKLNLFLHVTGRRADGYHLLQTVFQLLDHGDTLFFDVRRDGAIRRAGGPRGVAMDDDLTVRAARALQAATGCALGVDIRLDKRIPVGGGLGGGSSDCATTLVALNRLWDLRLDEDRLAQIGLSLGADVPVFVRGTSAWAEGVGETLTPVALPERWYLVLTPGPGTSTRDIFAAPELPRATPKLARPARLDDAFLAQTHNDCEAVVTARDPAVAAALAWLRERAPARMSGTGASVFAALPTRAAAQALQAQVPAAWPSFVARGLDVSPLQAASRAPL